MIEHANDFQLLSRYHAIIEELRGNPHPRLLLISRSKGAVEGQPFARLVPTQVGEFIEKVKLYKPDPDREIGPQGQRIDLYDIRTQVLC